MGTQEWLRYIESKPKHNDSKTFLKTTTNNSDSKLQSDDRSFKWSK